MTIPTTPRPAPAVPGGAGSAPGIPSRYAPFAAAMDSLAQSSRTMVSIQSRPFHLIGQPVDGQPLRMAYVVTGPSAEAVQRAVADIVDSIGNGQADFTLPYRAGLSWEAKGITERAP